MSFELGYESSKIDRTCYDGLHCHKSSSPCDKCLITCSGIDNDLIDFQYL